MVSELAERTLDGAMSTEYSLSGNFVKVPVKGRSYWYFEDRTADPVRKYVGPVEDEDLSRRVEDFRGLKNDLRLRKQLVRTLVRDARLPAPEPFTGDVVAALAKAGFFRLRGVLVGTVAYGVYGNVLGVRMGSAGLQTADVDLAQFHSVSVAIGDTIPPILDVLHEVDPSFAPVPELKGPLSTRFDNASRYRVEFLTPNTGSDDNAGTPAPMPALGGAGATALRFLDFLIHEPVRGLLLHREGIPVLVPAPERYAVHKLIVATERKSDPNGIGKRDKDLFQSGFLIEALEQTRRRGDLREVFEEAWERGPKWRAALTEGADGLAPRPREILREIVGR